MTQSRVRFGILGFGHHAVRRLLPAFAKCTEATLTGMWRRDQAAAVRAGQGDGAVQQVVVPGRSPPNRPGSGRGHQHRVRVVDGDVVVLAIG